MTQPFLITLNGPDEGRKIPLPGVDLTIGRSVSNAISILWDDSVSRRHAQIIHHLGLIWVEDLGSTNGTYLISEGAEPCRLESKKPALLLENCRLRIGHRAIFGVEGIPASQNEAIRLLQIKLQSLLALIYSQLSNLSEEDRTKQVKAIREFESRLKDSKDENELSLLIAQGFQTFSIGETATRHENLGQLHQQDGDEGGLPPLPDDLPAPDSPNRVPSVLNIFISDIQKYFPKEDDRSSNA